MKKLYDITSALVAFYVAILFLSPIWDLVRLFSLIVEDELFKLLSSRSMANFLDLVLGFGLGLLALYVSYKIFRRISLLGSDGLHVQNPWSYVARLFVYYLIATLSFIFSTALFSPVLY